MSTGLPFVIFTCVSHTNAAGAPLCVVTTSLDQWQSSFLTKTSAGWRMGRFPDNPTTKQLRDQGNTIYAKFRSVTKDIIRPESISHEYVNKINFDMFRPPDPLPQQFGFLCFNENGRAFSGRSREAKPEIGLEALQMFQEMCRCWKCRYLHHYNSEGSSDPRTEPSIAPESYVQTSLNCLPPLRCAEDLARIQCVELRSK